MELACAPICFVALAACLNLAASTDPSAFCPSRDSALGDLRRATRDGRVAERPPGARPADQLNAVFATRFPPGASPAQVEGTLASEGVKLIPWPVRSPAELSVRRFYTYSKVWCFGELGSYHAKLFFTFRDGKLVDVSGDYYQIWL